MIQKNRNEYDTSLHKSALEDAWRRGFRTFDVAAAGSTVVGTFEMGERIAESVARLAPERGLPALAR
jgi:hypothetical protein